MEFEVLGFAPFDRRLIIASLLEPEELRWLNAYHESTLTRIGPLLDQSDRNWLADAVRRLRTDKGKTEWLIT